MPDRQMPVYHCCMQELTRQASKEGRARVKMMTLDFEAMSSSTQGVVRLAYCDFIPIPCKHSSTTQACACMFRNQPACKGDHSEHFSLVVQHTSDARSYDNKVRFMHIGASVCRLPLFSTHLRLRLRCSRAGHRACVTTLPVQPLLGCFSQSTTSDWYRSIFDLTRGAAWT